jgi:hypothetical protein
MELSNPDNKWHEGHYKGFLDALPGLFNTVVDFISAILAIRSPNDGVAY